MSARLAPGVFFGRSLRSSTLGDLTLIDVRYATGAARHHHERAYFCLIRRGAYEERFGRRTRLCRPGSVVFHPPGESHAQRLCTASVAVLNVELGPEWLGRMGDRGVPVDQPIESGDCELSAMAARLLPHIGRRGPDSLLAVESLTAEILGCVARRLTPQLPRVPQWLSDARDQVEADPAHPPTLGAMAAAAGVHPVYLAQAFRRFYGCSPGEYARRRRLDHARRQLASAELPLARIAADAGFADQSHFTRTFKRFTGVTPRRYRTFLAFKTG